MTYFPPAGAWDRINPAAVGLNPARLADAVTFAENAETPWPRDLDKAEFLPSLTQDEPPPWNEILGPVAARGGPAGRLRMEEGSQPSPGREFRRS